MLVNATLYDGCLEKVCIEMGITCCSQSDKQGPFTTGLSLVKSELLELWKKREGVMEKKLPRYQAEVPESEVPPCPTEPELKLCSLVDGALVLPRDVRTEFMTDPIRGPEWRKIVTEFDRCFTLAAKEAACQSEKQTQDSPPSDAAGGGETSTAWDTVFPDEPRAKAAWREKYDAKIKGKCQWCPQLTAYIVDDPDGPEANDPPKYMLFVEASQDYTIPLDEVFLAYGAGTWLLDAKADSYIEENANGFKGVLCQFDSDAAEVVLEDLCPM